MLKSYAMKSKDTGFGVLSTLCELHAKEMIAFEGFDVTLLTNAPPDIRCDICDMIRNAPPIEEKEL